VGLASSTHGHALAGCVADGCSSFVFCPMAIGQLKVTVLRTYGIANGAAVPTSPDRGK
jgi:hypothetical protein